MAYVQHSTDPTTNLIVGAAIEVHRTIGPGVLESTYNRCLRRELVLRGVPFESEVSLPLEYKGVMLDHGYVIDYMRLRKVDAGLLINFKVPLLKDGLKRILL